ncbi:MAG: sulfite exporter TauE/SafE family protein [Acidobacteriota bacterium]
MTWAWAGLALGFVGSVHCAAMCGPFVAAVRRGVYVGGDTGDRAWRHAAVEGALYQLSRVGTYGALGSIAGAIGQTVLVGVIGRSLAIGLGLWFLAMGSGLFAGRLVPGRGAVVRAIAPALAFVRRHRLRHPHAAAAAGGIVNGFLPCGLVYAALAAAVATGRPLDAAAFMLAFGAGTLPMMTALWTATRLAPVIAPRLHRFAVPVALSLVGLLLLGRGVLPAGAVVGQHAHQMHVR